MKLFSEQQLQISRAYLSKHARSLDKQLAEFYFWGGSSADVRDVLKGFQNTDGGFGKCIEPDFRLHESSPMGTSIGLQYAQEIGLPATDSIIQAAVRYLLDTYDTEEKRWHAVPETINQVPHAPWWSFDETTGRCGVEGRWANPNAEILGFLWSYNELVPRQFLNLLCDKAMSELEQMPEKFDLHDFLCYQRLYRCAPEPYSTAIKDKLRQSATLTVEVSPEQWGNYGAKPLQIVDSPKSPFASLLNDAIELNLDYEIEHVNEDGSWSPNWSWYGNYDEEWVDAQREWKGYLTVRNLKLLHDFGRIQQA